MTAVRRLSKIEGSLTPTQAVCCWLTEAWVFASLASYADSTLDLPDAAMPLEQIAARVETAVRAARKGETRTATGQAVGRAVGDAIFIYELVLGLNAAASECARLGWLRLGLLAGLLEADLPDPGAADPPAPRARPTRAIRGAADPARPRRDLVEEIVDDLHVEAEARSHLEARYLDGVQALFPEGAQERGCLAEQAQLLASAAATLDQSGRAGGRRRRRPSPPERIRSLADRVESRADELADDARAAAFELLGERRLADDLVTRRLRAHHGGPETTPVGQEGGGGRDYERRRTVEDRDASASEAIAALRAVLVLATAYSLDSGNRKGVGDLKLRVQALQRHASLYSLDPERRSVGGDAEDGRRSVPAAPHPLDDLPLAEGARRAQDWAALLAAEAATAAAIDRAGPGAR
jgi:hypothetical protein